MAPAVWLKNGAEYMEKRHKRIHGIKQKTSKNNNPKPQSEGIATEKKLVAVPLF